MIHRLPKASAKLIEEAEAEKPALHLSKSKRAMQEYRAYLIGPDGHIQSRVDLVCENEGEARERVKQYVGSCYVELWQRDKLIVRFKGKEPPK